MVPNTRHGSKEFNTAGKKTIFHQANRDLLYVILVKKKIQRVRVVASVVTGSILFPLQ